MKLLHAEKNYVFSMIADISVRMGPLIGEEGAHPARRKRKKTKNNLSTYRRVVTIPENIYYNQDGD